MDKVNLIILLFFLNLSITFSQEVYQHVSNRGVYEFLDEMGNLQFIELNSSVKPYSRLFIAEKLAEVQDMVKTGSIHLNKRQAGELEFYLRDYHKELLPGKDYKKRPDIFYHKDSIFTFSINPILGIEYWHNKSGSAYHRWNGAEAFAYVKNFGFYVSLRDNHESVLLSKESYLNTRQGANYKILKDGGYDFSEMRGGISYQWKWGSIALVKDHFEWGNYSHYPNIFSAKIPSIAQVKLKVKPADWFEFHFMHGWLVSEVIDSVNSYTFTNSYGTTRRDLMRKKYLSANLFTVKPFKNLFISAGNSVIFSDVQHAAYLIPLMFFKSVDHTLNATDRIGRNVGQNSQMFFDISSRQIKHLHLHASMFIDELSIARFFKKDEYNFVSYKAGFHLSDFPPNTFLAFEWVRTNPLVYKHNVITTTFESNGYNLGHYLQDNAREIYISAGFRPVKKLLFKTEFIYAEKGKDHDSLGTYRIGIPFMDSVQWSSKTWSFLARYQVFNDAFIFLSYIYSSIPGEMFIYNPEIFTGTQHTFSGGVNIGF